MAGRRGWKAWSWPLLKGLVGAAVLGAVGRQVWKAVHDLAQRQDALRLDPKWLAASVGRMLENRKNLFHRSE